MTDRDITTEEYYSYKSWGVLTQEQLKEVYEALTGTLKQ